MNLFIGPRFYLGLLVLMLSPALFTSRVLLPADILHGFVPWAGAFQAAGPPENPLISDVMEQFYPYHHFLRSEVSQGRFPLWNPYALCGTSFLAPAVTAALSPLAWVLIVLPVNLYFEWSALIKLLMAGSGIYFYCRGIGLGKLPSTVGGLIYLFAGYNVYYLCFPNTATSMLLGWGLLTLERFLQSRDRRWLAALGVIVGFGYLAGHVESGLLHHLAYLLYVLIRDRRRLLAVGAVSTLGFLLAAAMVLPFIDFMFESATFAQRSSPGRNPYFIPIQYAPGLLIPYFTGSPVRWPGGSLEGVAESFVYLGVLPFFLVCLSLSARKMSSATSPLLAVHAVSLAILFGLPGIFDLFTALPVLRQGNHMHVVQILQATGAVLAAIGLSAVKTLGIPGYGYRLALGAVLALLLPGVYTHLHQWRQGADFFFLWDRFPFPIYSAWTLASLVVAVVLTRTRRYGLVMLFLLTVNGLLFAARFNPVVKPEQTVNFEPSAIRMLGAAEPDRVVGLGPGTLLPNYPMRWRLREIRGYESLVGKRAHRFFATLSGDEADPHFFIREIDERKLAILNRAACRYIISPFPLELGGLEAIADDFPFVYRTGTDGRVHFAGNVLYVSSEEEAYRHILTEMDTSQVSLETYPRAVSEASGADIVVLKDVPGRLEVTARTGVDAWLIFRESCAKGWKASINGHPVPVVRADFLFQAVHVPAGIHRVHFKYSPDSFRYGLAISLLSALGLLLLFVYGNRFRVTPGKNNHASRQDSK
jgi:hypothetical protein